MNFFFVLNIVSHFVLQIQISGTRIENFQHQNFIIFITILTLIKSKYIRKKSKYCTDIKLSLFQSTCINRKFQRFTARVIFNFKGFIVEKD